MPNDTRLREQARAVIESAKFPARSPDRIWGGNGIGAICAVCDWSVTGDELELEIEFAGSGARGGDKFHLHIRCFAVWELELDKALKSGVRAGRRGRPRLIA